MNRRSFGLLILLLVLVWPATALGQVDVSTATLKGTVLDPNGGVVAGATITVTNPEKGISKTAKSGSDGIYQIPLLPPGSYDLQVDATGFSREVVRDLQMTLGQTTVYDMNLRVGAVTSVVEVTAEAPLLQVEQTQQANTINQNQVENLPNINRSMTAAVFTLPGVSDSEATRSQQPGFTGFATTGFSIGGSNGRNNLSTVDGGENEYGSGQYRVILPPDAIQEFQVNRNAFAAEFGFTVGSSVNVVTKSGTNQFHGSAYGYFRDAHTSANNFIDQLRTGQKLFSQNVYAGGTFGGPIKKDKLFLFTIYDFQKLDGAGFNQLLNSPSALGINGTSPAGLAQANYANLLAASGNATLAGVATGLKQALVPQSDPNLLKMMTRDNGSFDNLTKAHFWETRVDYQPNSTNSLNFRFELSRALIGAQSYPDGASLVTRDYSILT